MSRCKWFPVTLDLNTWALKGSGALATFSLQTGTPYTV